MRDLSTQTSSDFDSSLDQIISSARQLADDFQLSDAKVLIQNFSNRVDSVRIHLAYIHLLTDFESLESALEYAEEVESQLNPHTVSSENLAEFFNVLADLYRRMGLYSLARRSQQISIQHDLSLNRLDGLSARTLLGQAEDLFHQKDITSAKYLLNSLRKRSDEIGIQARRLLAKIYLAEQETSAAKMILEEALERCECVQLKVDVLRLMCITCSHNEEYSAALQYLEAAIDLAKRSASCVNQLSSLQKQNIKLKRQVFVSAQNGAWN